MEIQQKEQIYSQVQMMAKFTGETVNKDSLFSFLDEPKMTYKPKQGIERLNNEITGKISELVGAGLEELEISGLEANVQKFSTATLPHTAGLKNAMENIRVSEAVNIRKEKLAEKAEQIKQPAPEKAPAAPTSVGPSL